MSSKLAKYDTAAGVLNQSIPKPTNRDSSHALRQTAQICPRPVNAAPFQLRSGSISATAAQAPINAVPTRRTEITDRNQQIVHHSARTPAAIRAVRDAD